MSKPASDNPNRVPFTSEGRDLFVAQHRCNQDNAVYCPVLKQRQILQFLLLLILRVADENFVIHCVRPLFNSLDNLGMIGYPDIEYDDAQRHGLPGSELLAHGVRCIVQFLNGLQYLTLRFLSYQRTVVQYAGYRRGRDIGNPGNIDNFAILHQITYFRGLINPL
ncbi:hypothetical protein D3C78_1210550 [compost metagenome]